MRPFSTITGLACPLPMSNIDTDQIIPARFLRRPRAEGYAICLFHDLRFDAEGQPSDFPLNQPAYAASEILLAGRNFGGGSSREGAVYALIDFGIRVVIAPSFGDIFAANAVKNGLLLAQVTQADLQGLLATEELLAAQPVSVDLGRQIIARGNLVVPFSIDPVSKHQLETGQDDIDLTLAHAGLIDAFCVEDRKARPWAAAPEPAAGASASSSAFGAPEYRARCRPGRRLARDSEPRPGSG